MMETRKGREFIGTVVSTGNAKTIKVRVDLARRHPLYKKAMRRTKNFAVHNELADIHVGELIRIREVRPISKTKHFIAVAKL